MATPRSSGKKQTLSFKPVRPRRDFEALSRLRAADMFRRGKHQADVARALGVSGETASEGIGSGVLEGGRP